MPVGRSRNPAGAGGATQMTRYPLSS